MLRLLVFFFSFSLKFRTILYCAVAEITCVVPA